MSPITETKSVLSCRGEAAVGCMDVAAAAEARLHQSAFFELHRVACEFDGGVLTLRGRVTSYYLKQMAQALLDNLEGVSSLNNQLDVFAPPTLPRLDQSDWRGYARVNAKER